MGPMGALLSGGVADQNSPWTATCPVADLSLTWAEHRESHRGFLSMIADENDLWRQPVAFVAVSQRWLAELLEFREAFEKQILEDCTHAHTQAQGQHAAAEAEQRSCRSEQPGAQDPTATQAKSGRPYFVPGPERRSSRCGRHWRVLAASADRRPLTGGHAPMELSLIHI